MSSTTSKHYNIVIHIGLHKTATGVLQRQFFPAINDVNLLTTQNAVFKQFVNLVTKQDPIYFCPETAFNLLKPELDASKVNVISNESLSALPYSGVIEAGLDHRSPILANLHAVFPDASILLVLRKQDGMARSLYRQYLKSGGTRSIERFYARGKEKNHEPVVTLDRFLYSKYVDKVFELFPDRVKLMAYENFVADRKRFVQSIAEFVGTQCPEMDFKAENVTTLTPGMLEVSRFLNVFFRSLVNQAGIIPGLRTTKHGIDRKMSPVQFLHDHWPFKPKANYDQSAFFRIARDIFEDCKADNERLDKSYQLNLKALNYY